MRLFHLFTVWLPQNVLLFATHTANSSCAFFVILYFFYSMSENNFSVDILWLIHVCIRWGVRKKLNIVWLAKHYLIWHGQLSRRQYILSLAFAFVCRAQFNAQEWKRDRERESEWKERCDRKEERKKVCRLGWKRNTLNGAHFHEAYEARTHTPCANVFAKMNNRIEKWGGKIFMAYKMNERTVFGIVCWNSIKPDGQTNMTFHCS